MSSYQFLQVTSKFMDALFFYCIDILNMCCICFGNLLTGLSLIFEVETLHLKAGNYKFTKVCAVLIK